jgi:predicted nucleic acid-binding Zn ribbon protein
MLPIKMGTASEELYERSGLRPTHVGMKCPHCGADNPYTRTRCGQCDGLLAAAKARGNPYQMWIYLGAGVIVLVVLFMLLGRG